MDSSDIESCFAEFPHRDWEHQPVEGRIRIAAVGLENFARNRAVPAIEDAEYTDLTVLVSGSPEKVGRLADEYGVEHVLSYDEFKDGKATNAYDALYVATPNAYHAEYTEAAADLGKHVLCENIVYFL